MYIPKHNSEHDLTVVRALVRDYGFGTMIVPRSDGQIEISHLPFLLEASEGGDRLRVHVARANRIWRDALAGDRHGDIVIVFHGPHGYVSPTWYERGREDVPTWNYAVVHAHVTTPREMSEAELHRALDDLARANETSAAPWRFDELPGAMKDRLVPAIVGLELPVARWETKLKLSQNRTPADHARVVAAFEARGFENDRAMVAMMRART